MPHFHTEWNEEHRDWQCRCGIAFGAGKTPQEAEIACCYDLGGFSDSPGWIGAPDTHNPAVEFEHTGWSWVAYWYEPPYRYQCSGAGDTPEEAERDLLERFCAM